MGMFDYFSSVRKKYFSLSHWMDVDGMKENAGRVGGLFKELKDVSKPRQVDAEFEFEDWLSKNNLTEKGLHSYCRRLQWWILGYVLLFVVLFSYGVYFVIDSRFLLSIYVFILSGLVFLYFVKQYLVWSLVKMRRGKSNFREMIAFTKSYLFSKK